MASNVTRLDLRTLIRGRGDFRSDFVSDTEINSYINDSLAALYDLLITHEPSRFRSTADFTISSGIDEYTITSQASDFYRAIGVDVAESSSQTGYWPLYRFEWEERNDYTFIAEKEDTRYEIRGGLIRLHPVPTWSGSIRLHYIPTAPSLSDDITTWDSVNKWTEWVVLDCLIKCATKEESDPSAWMAERARVEQRIVANAEVDHGQPRTVIDIYRGRRSRRRRGLPDGWWS